MNKVQILVTLRKILDCSLPSKGIEYLYHLVENSNRYITYLSLFQEIQKKRDQTQLSGYVQTLPIEMSDMCAVNEVLNRLQKINKMILTEEHNEPIEVEKEQLRQYLREVYSGKKVTVFDNEFQKIKRKTMIAIKKAMKKLKEEKPALHEELRCGIYRTANSVMFYEN